MRNGLHLLLGRRRGRTRGWMLLAGICLGLTLTSGWSPTAKASYWENIPESDFKYLPKYCVLAVQRYGRPPPGDMKWASKQEMESLYAFERRVGCGGHFHHYCAGLWELHLSGLPHPEPQEAGLLREAISEFNYLRRGCSPDSPIIPEILTNQARAYIGLQNYEGAVKDLSEAIRRNRTYEPAYAELSGVYLRLNNRDDARKILEDGLKFAPNSRFLKVKLEHLQGTGDKGPPAPDAAEAPAE